jgi:CBS domain-containing protein
MATVEDLIGAKTDASRYAVRANETVYKAIRLMADRHIGCVLVVDQARVIGIFTERDYIMRVEVEGRATKDTILRDVMTGTMYTVTTNTSIERCLGLMTLRHIRHLPIVDEGKLMGIISMRDAVAAILNDHEVELQGLEDYSPGTDFQG